MSAMKSAVRWKFDARSTRGVELAVEQTKDLIDRDLVKISIGPIPGTGAEPVEALLGEDDLIVLMECALARLRFNQKKGRTNQDPIAALRPFFKIEDKRPEREYWILICKKCPKRWSLGAPEHGEKVHGGNILNLLNHAFSHEESHE